MRIAMIKPLLCIIGRDLTLCIRRRGEWIMPMIYFLMVASLFPVAIDPTPEVLAKLAPGTIWVAVVLSLLMSLENLFRTDYQAGSLEYLMLSPYPLPVLVLGKCIAHWVAVGIPLIVLAPLIGLLLNLSFIGIWILWITLLLGIPTLSLLGSVGVALTIGLHRGGILLAILGLPLMMPVIIFGTSAVVKANQNLPFTAELLLLTALLVLALGFVPLAVSAAIKVSVE